MARSDQEKVFFKAVGSGDMAGLRESSTPELLLVKDVDSGRTALMVAVAIGWSAGARELLAGSDPMARGRRGEIALHWAASKGSRRCVELLLEAGSDPDAKNDSGATALITAAWQGRVDAIEALLPWCDASIKAGAERRDALMIAAIRRNPGCVAALLKTGDPRARDAEGRDALMLAAAGTDDDAFACVALLLPESDVDATLPDDGWMGDSPTACGIAKLYGNERVASLIEGCMLSRKERAALEGFAEPSGAAKANPRRV